MRGSEGTTQSEEEILLAPGFPLNRKEAEKLRLRLLRFKEKYIAESKKNRPRYFLYGALLELIVSIEIEFSENLSDFNIANLVDAFQKILLLLVQNLELAYYFSKNSSRAKKEYLYFKAVCEKFVDDYVNLSSSHLSRLEKIKTRNRVIDEFFNLPYVLKENIFFSDKLRASKKAYSREKFIKSYAINLFHYARNSVEKPNRERNQPQNSAQQTHDLIDFLGDSFENNGDARDHLQCNSTYLARCFGVPEEIIQRDFADKAVSRRSTLDIYDAISKELANLSSQESYKKLENLQLILDTQDLLLKKIKMDIPGKDTSRLLQKELVEIKKSCKEKEWSILPKILAKDLLENKPKALGTVENNIYDSLLNALDNSTQYTQWSHAVDLLVNARQNMYSWRWFRGTTGSCEKVKAIIHRIFNWGLQTSLDLDKEHFNKLCEAFYFAVPILLREDVFDILYDNFQNLDNDHQLLLIHAAIESFYRDEKRNKKILEMLQKCSAPKEDLAMDHQHKIVLGSQTLNLNFLGLVDKYNSSINDLDRILHKPFTWFSNNNGHRFDVNQFSESLERLRQAKNAAEELDKTIKATQLQSQTTADSLPERKEESEKVTQLSANKIHKFNDDYEMDETVKAFVLKIFAKISAASSSDLKTSEILDELNQNRQVLEQKLSQNDWSDLKQLLDERRVLKQMQDRMRIIQQDPKLRIFYGVLVNEINRDFIARSAVGSGQVLGYHAPTARVAAAGTIASKVATAVPMCGGALSLGFESISTTVSLAGQMYHYKLSSRLSKLAFSPNDFSVFVQQIALALLDTVERNVPEDYLTKINGTAMVQSINEGDIEGYALRIKDLFFRYFESQGNKETAFELNLLDENFIKKFVDGLRLPVKKKSVYSYTMPAGDKTWFSTKIRTTNPLYKETVNADDFFMGKKGILRSIGQEEKSENSISNGTMQNDNKVNQQRPICQVTPIRTIVDRADKQGQRNNQEIQKHNQEIEKLKEKRKKDKAQIKELLQLLGGKNEKQTNSSDSEGKEKSVVRQLKFEDEEEKKKKDETGNNKVVIDSLSQSNKLEIKQAEEPFADARQDSIPNTEVIDLNTIPAKSEEIKAENPHNSAENSENKMDNVEEEKEEKGKEKVLEEIDEAKPDINVKKNDKEKQQTVIQGILGDLARFVKIQKEFSESYRRVSELVRDNEEQIKQFGTRKRDLYARYLERDPSIGFYCDHVDRYLEVIETHGEPLKDNPFATLTEIFTDFELFVTETKEIEKCICSAKESRKTSYILSSDARGWKLHYINLEQNVIPLQISDINDLNLILSKTGTKVDLGSEEIEQIKGLLSIHYAKSLDNKLTQILAEFRKIIDIDNPVFIQRLEHLLGIAVNYNFLVEFHQHAKRVFEEAHPYQLFVKSRKKYDEMKRKYVLTPLMETPKDKEIKKGKLYLYTEEDKLIYAVFDENEKIIKRINIYKSELGESAYNIILQNLRNNKELNNEERNKIFATTEKKGYCQAEGIKPNMYVLVQEENKKWTLRYYNNNKKVTGIKITNVDGLETILQQNDITPENISDDNKQRIVEKISAYHASKYINFKLLITDFKNFIQQFTEMKDKFLAMQAVKRKGKFYELLDAQPTRLLGTHMFEPFKGMKAKISELNLSQQNISSINDIFSYLQSCVNKFDQQTAHLYLNADPNRISNYLKFSRYAIFQPAEVGCSTQTSSNLTTATENEEISANDFLNS